MTEVVEHDQIALRKAKLAEIRGKGVAFPNDFKPTHIAEDLKTRYQDETTETLEKEALPVKLAGRMMTRRLMGKASFANVQDRSGQIQLYIARDLLPEGEYETFSHWDLGDIIAAEGVVFKTKTGELSVKVHRIKLLTKALRPLPDKFHGLVDHEARSRHRYLDLIANESARKLFECRSKTITLMRRFLDEHQFIEVETPMMHAMVGGANAKPFVTHHNALDMQLFLRIAPELFLKRLVVGGFERVYEINRNFRNEGLSTRHNPEFTMLEYYQAYATYTDLMNFTEELLRYLLKNLFNKTEHVYQGNTIDFAKPFERITLRKAILRECTDITEDILDDETKARAFAQSKNITIPNGVGLGKIQFEFFEKYVERKLVAPTFVTEFPKEVSPLARSNDENPFITDRFEFYAGGQEIANGFSELNDAEEQALRFHDQLAAGKAGDEEAMSFDEDYIMALEHGLPPTAGEGIGIDRLVMFLTDTPSIRDVILFPLLKPR
jgi:lysyl-tRNA synthetase class 2